MSAPASVGTPPPRSRLLRDGFFLLLRLGAYGGLFVGLRSALRPESEAGRPPELALDPGLWVLGGAAALELSLWLARSLWRSRGAPGGALRVAGGRLLLALCGVLGAFALVETALRVAGLPPPEVPRPADADRRAFEDERNPLGLREPWTTVPPRVPGELRIAVLGDSFVYGEAVPREAALPAALEAALRRRHPGRAFRVFNLGVCDNDTRQEAERYRRLHEVLDVDLLVLVAYQNDFTSANPAYTLHDIYDAGGEPGFVARHSRLAAHLWARLRLWLMRERSLAWYRSAALAQLSGGVEGAGRELVGLARFARERGVGFVLTLFPWLYRLRDYPLPELHERLGRFAAAQGLPFLDLLPTFAGRDDEPLRVSPANEHPSPAGHRLAAEALADFLTPHLRPRDSAPKR